MIEFVISVTILVQSLGITQDAYATFLGYQPVASGQVSAQEAASWATPDMDGAPYVLMRPESGKDVLLRFIEMPPTEGAEALKTHGWNATELLAQDPQALADRLRGSPFEIIGEPAALESVPTILAMQVRGPSGEILYLTRLQGESYRKTYGEISTFVDKPFILVVGGPDFQALEDFYGKRLQMPIIPFGVTSMELVSDAVGLPRETKYPLSLARLNQGYSFELDGYPPQAVPRPRREGELPPGMSMVSVAVKDLDAVGLDWRAPPQVLHGPHYQGRRSAVAVGPAGEWIEFVETGGS